ncbi:MAG: glycosyltransferase family 2 protein [candidate division Zixibacteria bacterium]
MTDSQTISIIIVNHRADDILDECLKHIAAGAGNLILEIIIIDNPPISSPKDYSGMFDFRIARVSTQKNIGFATACNLGASNSSGDYLLFLNPDLLVSDNTIEALYQALIKYAANGIVTGKLIGRDGEFQPSCRRFPTLKNVLFSRGSILRKFLNPAQSIYTYPDSDEIMEMEAAAAALMMISRDVFEKLSGFDESFFMYFEDTDLCYRVSKLGGKVLYVPWASGKHYWGYSTKRYRFRRIFWQHRSALLYFFKHFSRFRTAIILFPILSINCFLSLSVELFRFRR